MWFQNITLSSRDTRVIDLTPVLSPDHSMVFMRNSNYTNDYRDIRSLADTNSSAPAGSETNPYKVATPADLQKISETFETMRWSDFFIRQTADIDMKNAAPIAPIGIGTSGFTGHYAGGGYVIKNLTSSDCTGESLGLFNNIIHTESGVEPGLSHYYYEIIRADTTSDATREYYKRLCLEYHSHFDPDFEE